MLKNVPECDGAFPRWLASTRLAHPEIKEKYTTATAIIGVRFIHFHIPYRILVVKEILV
jgi:hypothetical protein